VQRIDADPDIEALAPAPFSTVCFRFRPSTLKALSGDARRRQACDEYLDRLNEAVLDTHITAIDATVTPTSSAITPLMDVGASIFNPQQ
jgi:hypothetical protein